MIRDDFRRSRRCARPQLEGLEDRKLLYATLGANWTFGERITYSFTPDGTSVGGISSNLHSKMASQGHSATWQDQVRRAASVWQAVAGINLAEVSDNGAVLGQSGGNQQNDPDYGDIRIAGVSLSASSLAQAYYPPPINGGALAGDFILNTDVAWKVNGSTYDLQTVAIHEFGHSLGMGHSAISTAVMYASYTASKQSLTTDDTDGIQSIYGTRQQDFLDANGSNGTLATADVITSHINTSTGQLAISDLEITSNSDNDFYKIQVPAVNNGRISVTVQSDNLSSLSPRVWLYNSAQQFIGSVSKALSYGDTATYTYVNASVTTGQTFYVRANAASTGPSGTGAYGLLVNFVTSSQSPVAPPDTTVTEQKDQGGGSGGLGSDGLDLHNDLKRLKKIVIGTLSGYGEPLTIGGHDHDDGHDHNEEPAGRGGTPAGPHAGFGPAPAFERAARIAEAFVAPSEASDAPIAPTGTRGRARGLSARGIDAVLPHWGRG